jgi:Ca2+-binding EF-hand superfamily protein
MKALQRAFDLFDLANNNEVASEELARILCSIGLSPSLDDLNLLIAKIDPHATARMSFDSSFMKYVVPHVRKSFLLQ